MNQLIDELRMLEEVEFSVEDTRQDLNAIVEFFQKQKVHERAMQIAIQQERKLPLSVAKEQRVFFVDEDFLVSGLPEKYRSESLGIVRKGYLIYAGRLVYPVLDVEDNVMGFCGWDKFAEPKYLDSKNHGYKAKYSTLYGMEKLPVYYSNNKPVYVTEGIVCCLYLRSIGLQALALLGSSVKPYVLQILKRFGNRLIVIPDNDIVGKEAEAIDSSAAGEHLVKLIKKSKIDVRVVQSTVAKDIDDTRNIQAGTYEAALKRDLINVAVNPYLKLEVLRLR